MMERYLLILLIFICPCLSIAEPFFRDVTEEMGVDFRHVNGFSAERRLVETVGSGGALFDYDNDGAPDLYLVQGNSLENVRMDVSIHPLSASTEPSTPTNRLYRNDNGIFTDVTATANVGDTGYGLGAVTADYDGDGYRDIYVTNLGANVLYRNNGDGTFTDVTVQANVGCPLLSASAAFADIDRDGDLESLCLQLC